MSAAQWTEKAVIKYHTIEHEIDAEKFLKNQLSLIKIIQKIKHNIEPDLKADIKIHAPKSGSIDITWTFQFVKTTIEQFFGIKPQIPVEFSLNQFLSNLSSAILIISALKGYIIKKILIKDKVTISIKIEDGKVLNFNTLNPRLIKQLLEDKIFSKDLIDYASSLEDTNTQDEVLQSIKVSRTGSTEEYYPIKITRQEAENIKTVLTNNNMIDKDLLKYDILEKRKVKVKKADLIGDQKWSFNFEGQSINAKIYDKVFLEK